jgi:hypothetical protein
MSRKRDKVFRKMEHASNSDIAVIGDEEFSNYPICVPISSTPIRGETINLLLVDDAGYFNNTKSEPIKPTQKKPSSERKRRLRLLK